MGWISNEKVAGSARDVPGVFYFSTHRSITLEEVRMNSSLIGKIDKAKRYAQEPERVTFQEFRVAFRGENDGHTVVLHDQRWHCSCGFFAERGLCSHTMALEKILGGMLPKEALSGAVTT